MEDGVILDFSEAVPYKSTGVSSHLSFGLQNCKFTVVVRVLILVESLVCRGAVAKGRSSSRAIAALLRRMAAAMLAANLYVVTPFCPTRLNTADDPTRNVPLRTSLGSVTDASWWEQDLYTLASHPRLCRWAANWVFLMLKLVGPQVLEFADRSIYPHPRLALRGAPSFQQMDFDASLGFLVHLIYPDPQGPLPGQSRDLEDQGIGNHLEVTAATEDHFTVEELVLVDIIEEIMRQLVQDPDIRPPKTASTAGRDFSHPIYYQRSNAIRKRTSTPAAEGFRQLRNYIQTHAQQCMPDPLMTTMPETLTSSRQICPTYYSED